MFNIILKIEEMFWKKPKSKDKLSLIDNLNLGSIEKNMIDKHGWSPSKAYRIANEYRDFLKLLAQNPENSIVPWTQDVDDFWHQHILDTRKYIDDCNKIFGYIIHHDPNTADNKSKHELAAKKTNELRDSLSSSSRYTDSSSSVSNSTNPLLFMAGAAMLSNSTSDDRESSTSSSSYSIQEL